MADNTLEINDDLEQRADVESFARLLEGKAGVYSMLARAYRIEIDEAMLQALHGMRFPLESGNATVDKGVRLLVDALSNLWENSLTDLAVDYARIFLGNGIDSYSASYPYESVYTSPKRLLMQEARNEVVAIYRSEGLDKSQEWKEAEDHIALELEFMQAMAARTAAALHESNDGMAAHLIKVQANFLECHLLNWVPMLTADMRSYAKTDFYLGLSYYTEGVLQSEKVFLDDVMGENPNLFA